MKFDNRSIPDVKALLDSYLDDQFLDFNTWDLRIEEQRKIGKALRHSLFGDARVPIESHLHIVPVLHPNDPSGNEDLLDITCRVPWSMLTGRNDANFLALNFAMPVAITFDAAPVLGARPESYDIRQPAAPRLLLVMPEVIQAGAAQDTGAKAHKEALLNLLLPYYEGLNAKHNIECVRTVEEYQNVFTRTLFYPEIIYFYGHGRSLGRGAIFEFEKAGRQGVSEWIQVDQIHNEIKKVEFAHRPPLVFFNACQGAAASQESALRTFAKSSSCVIAMRTVVRMDASRTLAENVLKSVIIDGFSPPIAVREVLRNMPSTWMGSGHWASIAVAAQFTNWTSLGTVRPVAEANDAVGDFPSRVDRSEPLAKIETILQENLNREPAEKDPSVFLWSGAPDEMPVQFGQRTRDVIVERFPSHRPLFFDVTLQQNASPANERDLRNQFCVAIVKALANDLDIDMANPGTVQSVIMNISPGRKGILALSHGPLSAAHAGLVEAYVRLWRDICGGLATKEAGPRIALAFGFEADATEPLALSNGNDTIRLGSVSPAEIKTHLSRYRSYYYLSESDLDAKTEHLSNKTSGVFLKLVGELMQLANLKT
ncbi:hypothetical protein [Pararhizobium sp. DWP3-4]|uniref:hypothetical protein n=1 Tax=Pararhizobium sp. DWP3-4 TaxID=2804565 RepID=UPI003CE92182